MKWPSGLYGEIGAWGGCGGAEVNVFGGCGREGSVGADGRSNAELSDRVGWPGSLGG